MLGTPAASSPPTLQSSCPYLHRRHSPATLIARPKPAPDSPHPPPSPISYYSVARFDQVLPRCLAAARSTTRSPPEQDNPHIGTIGPRSSPPSQPPRLRSSESEPLPRSIPMPSSTREQLRLSLR